LIVVAVNVPGPFQRPGLKHFVPCYFVQLAKLRIYLRSAAQLEYPWQGLHASWECHGHGYDYGGDAGAVALWA